MLINAHGLYPYRGDRYHSSMMPRTRGHCRRHILGIRARTNPRSIPRYVCKLNVEIWGRYILRPSFMVYFFCHVMYVVRARPTCSGR